MAKYGVNCEALCLNLYKGVGCKNSEEAGDNAEETRYMTDIPISCRLASKPNLQPTCKGYFPRPTSNILPTTQSEKIA